MSVSAYLTLFTSYSGNVAIFRTKVYYTGRCTLHHNTAPKKTQALIEILFSIYSWLSFFGFLDFCTGFRLSLFSPYSLHGFLSS